VTNGHVVVFVSYTRFPCGPLSRVESDDEENPGLGSLIDARGSLQRRVRRFDCTLRRRAVLRARTRFDRRATRAADAPSSRSIVDDPRCEFGRSGRRRLVVAGARREARSLVPSTNPADSSLNDRFDGVLLPLCPLVHHPWVRDFHDGGIPRPPARPALLMRPGSRRITHRDVKREGGQPRLALPAKRTRGQHPAYITRSSILEAELRDGSSSERCRKRPPPIGINGIIIIAEIYVRRFSRDLLLRAEDVD